MIALTYSFSGRWYSIVEFPGDDENGDVDDTDEDEDGEADGRKDVKGIQVEVLDVSYEFGPKACCLINNRNLRKLLDANDKVILSCSDNGYTLGLLLLLLQGWRRYLIVRSVVVCELYNSRTRTSTKHWYSWAGAFLGSEDIRGNCPWKARASRRRRRWGGRVRGGGIPLPGGAVPPPQKIFVIFHFKWCIFMQFGIGIFTLKGV